MMPTTKKLRILALLTDRRYHSARELARAGGFRYGARIKELRNDGYTFAIKRSERDPQLFLYRLTAKPAVRVQKATR